MKRLTLALLLLAACGSARPSAPRDLPATSEASKAPSGAGGGSSAASLVPGAPQSAGVRTRGTPEKSPGSGVVPSGAPSPSGGIGSAASYCKPGYCDPPVSLHLTGLGASSVAGTSTWYRWHPGEAAAGPGLRAFLGPDWRGKLVTVIAPGCTCAPIVVRLTDWCLCRDDRIIDLDRASFAALVDPSFGIIRVLVMEGDWR